MNIYTGSEYGCAPCAHAYVVLMKIHIDLAASINIQLQNIDLDIKYRMQRMIIKVPLLNFHRIEA